jgi:beta-lactam-binding protein with PASTA domain
MTLLAMTSVALLSALITMRLAIHTGEVEVPNLAGLTLEEAADTTSNARLNLTVENRFYSTTVPAGRVLSQSPSPGASVRKGWHMRITESMGPQRVAIPDTVGMNERDAAMAIRRASLDLGAIAHIPAPGAADTVLAQTPPANAEGVDKPEVSLLLSQPESASPRAYVMPNLVGMSYTAASAKMREIDLRIYAIIPQQIPVAIDPNAPAGTPPPAPVATLPAGVVLTQTPAAGMRVSSSDTPRVKMSAAAVATPTAATPPVGATTAAAPGAAGPKPAPVIRQAPLTSVQVR